MPYAWLPALARYRNIATGEFVSRDTVLGYVSDGIEAAKTASPVSLGGVTTAGSNFLAQVVGTGMMSPTDWSIMMRGEIKREYIRQYLLGIGGVEQMTPTDWGSIGGMLAEQYRFLDGFADAIAAGNLSEAQIRARAAMYINSARESYERANRRAQIKAGMTEMRWVLDPSAKNCEGCDKLASLGWQPVTDDPFGGAYPGSGSTPCRTNCQCHLEYR